MPVGGIVHYMPYGTPGGEYTQQCRAAIITERHQGSLVSLAVLNPTGLFFDRHIEYANPAEQRGGSWHYRSDCDS